MKKIFIVLALLIASCSKPCKEKAPIPPPTIVVIHDTVRVKDTIRISAKCDSLSLKIDSLEKRLFVAKYKIEKVKFYLKVVDRKPSQKVFLKGWVARAVR